jgi:YVTN family beta-propeller protein
MNMVTTHPRRMLSVGWRVCLAALFAASVEAQPVAYVTNSASGSVSVIDTPTNVVVRTIAVGNRPSRLLPGTHGQTWVLFWEL